MLRSTSAGSLLLKQSVALGLALLAGAACADCTKNTDGSAVVTAPVSSTSASAVAPATMVAAVALADASAPATGDLDAGSAGESAFAEDIVDGGTAQYRACQTDADCVAVRRVGCCNNGWLQAVNVSQQDAYRRSFTCPSPRPMCPMYVVHDTRVPQCNQDRHMCVMMRTQP